MSNCFEKSSDERSNSSQFGVKGQLKDTGAILTKRQMEWEVDSEVEVMDNGEVEVMDNENEMNTEPTNALTIQGTTDCQPRAKHKYKRKHTETWCTWIMGKSRPIQLKDGKWRTGVWWRVE